MCAGLLALLAEKDRMRRISPAAALFLPCQCNTVAHAMALPAIARRCRARRGLAFFPHPVPWQAAHLTAAKAVVVNEMLPAAFANCLASRAASSGEAQDAQTATISSTEPRHMPLPYPKPKTMCSGTMTAGTPSSRGARHRTQWPELTKCPDFTHKRTQPERAQPGIQRKQWVVDFRRSAEW